MDVRRREFFTGALRLRSLALACTGAVVWTHAVGVARGAGSSVRPPGALAGSDVLGANWIYAHRDFHPVGLIADGSRWLRRRLAIRGDFRVSHAIRHWIMGVALPVCAATGVAAFEWLSPIGIVQRELIYGVGPGLFATLGVLILVDLHPRRLPLFVAPGFWRGQRH